MTTSQDGQPDASELEDSLVIPKSRAANRDVQSTLPIVNIPHRPSLDNVSVQNSLSSPQKSDVTDVAAHQMSASPSRQRTTLNHDTAGEQSQQHIDPKAIIMQAFSPHVAILTSPDTDQIMFEKGLLGGLLQLLRPFGDQIVGKVTIRDSVGSSKSFKDYGVRFAGLRETIRYQQVKDRQTAASQYGQATGVSQGSSFSRNAKAAEEPSVAAIEDVVEHYLTQLEYGLDGRNSEEVHAAQTPSFYALLMQKILAGLSLSRHESFAHPVACVIAISSRNVSPIEELRNLYASTNNGDCVLPNWVDNEYLRYYLLIHDEDNDDIGKSTVLFDQMKRHFGLHCHLLRLRSAQCISSDDNSTKLAESKWLLASEELSNISTKGDSCMHLVRSDTYSCAEFSNHHDDSIKYIFESDAMSLRSFVRELVTQSVIPYVERQCAKWNEHVLSKRRGISGRFMSLSKRFTPFSSVRSPSGFSTGQRSSSNYDSIQGTYRADQPEAILRRLADFSFMLRDFKLAQSTYDILRGDFNNDKAWKHYAGANEMAAVSLLLITEAVSSKVRIDLVDQMLETASYSYATRCASQYYPLRTLLLGTELLKVRGAKGAVEAARWAFRIIEMRLVGFYGQALFTERITACYLAVPGTGHLNLGAKMRKAAFWAMLASDSWLRLEKLRQAERCLDQAEKLYGLENSENWDAGFDMICEELHRMRSQIASMKEKQGLGELNQLRSDSDVTEIEEVNEKIDQRPHRKSLIGHANSFGQPDSLAISPLRSAHGTSDYRNDKFE